VSVHVALLAGVTVGGNRKAPAATLKALSAERGWKRAETLLSSGNIIADTGRDTAAKVATHLANAIEETLAFARRRSCARRTNWKMRWRARLMRTSSRTSCS